MKNKSLGKYCCFSSTKSSGINTVAERISHLDIARGWAIILVVLGHAIQYTVSTFDQHWGFRLIYAVHMPLFMFISGYVTTIPEEQWFQHVKRLRFKARQLLLPFIVWIPLGFIVSIYLQSPPGFVGDFWAFLARLLRSPDTGLWFLLVLFECNVLFLIVSFWGRRYAVWAAMALLLAINVLVMLWPEINWFGIGLLRWYFLFFLAGNLTRHLKWKMPSLGQTVYWVLAYGILVSFWYRKSVVPVDIWLPGANSGLRLLLVQGYHAITAFVGIGAILGICSALSTSPWTRWPRHWLVYLGTRSLEIYVGQYLFLFAAIVFFASWPISENFRIMLVASSALFGALLLARLVSQINLLDTLLYGHRYLQAGHQDPQPVARVLER